LRVSSDIGSDSICAIATNIAIAFDVRHFDVILFMLLSLNHVIWYHVKHYLSAIDKNNN
jgi:hypothetical protein